VLIDRPNKEWDQKISKFVLMKAVTLHSNPTAARTQQLEQERDDHGIPLTSSEFNHKIFKEERDLVKPLKSFSLLHDVWSVELLRDYLVYIKTSFHPEMKLEAKLLLVSVDC
jgi:DNA replicative helicase MCM subunit Mcm2 (Cdc46/Mcm family)